MKLAEALLLRKELQAKVDRLKRIDNKDLFTLKTGRKRVDEGFDDLIAEVPKVEFEQLTHCYDWHAKQLRRVDAAIQKANWDTEVIDTGFTQEYKDPYHSAA